MHLRILSEGRNESDEDVIHGVVQQRLFYRSETGMNIGFQLMLNGMAGLDIELHLTVTQVT
jgi:hypothetical protein